MGSFIRKRLQPVAGWRRFASMAMMLGSICPVARAEDAAAAKADIDSGVLQEIIVTAERREGDMQKTPIAVTALSGQDLKSQSVTGFSDIARSVPGLSISSASTTAPGAALPVVYIRGIGQQDPSIFQDPGVGIYVDGVYVARSAGSAIDLPDIYRVEVLRGPQGTLFGKNAVGGAINIVTHYARNYGLLSIFFYSGIAIGSVGYGAIHDRTGSYLPALTVTTALLLIAAVLFWALPRPSAQWSARVGDVIGSDRP